MSEAAKLFRSFDRDQRKRVISTLHGMLEFHHSDYLGMPLVRQLMAALEQDHESITRDERMMHEQNHLPKKDGQMVIQEDDGEF
jgi:hypothetical protein